MFEYRREIFRREIFPAGSSFTERDLAERDQQFLTELQRIFPALTTLNKCVPEIRHELVNGAVVAILDLVEIPQQCLMLDRGPGTRQGPDRILKESIATVIDSARDTQHQIYVEAHQALSGQMAQVSGRTEAEHQLHSLMRRYRNQEVKFATPSGQVRIDFPDLPDFRLTMESSQISGLIECVAPDRIKVARWRFAEGELGHFSRQSVWQGKWIHFSSHLDHKRLGHEALAAAHARRRVTFQVQVAVKTLTNSVSHFVLQAPLELPSRQDP